MIAAGNSSVPGGMSFAMLMLLPLVPSGVTKQASVGMHQHIVAFVAASVPESLYLWLWGLQSLGWGGSSDLIKAFLQAWGVQRSCC